MVESIGKRIAYLRQKHSWTQQSLADRLAMSRVAISHIEMDLTIPSERSITLMAGLFKLSPTELVAGTSYPKAKAERLPDLTTTYTDLELDYALIKNDLDWIARLENNAEKYTCTQQVLDKWSPVVENWKNKYIGEHEMKLLVEIRLLLNDLNGKKNPHRE